MVGLGLVVLLAKVCEQDPKYGTTAGKMILGIAPAAIIGGVLGGLARRCEIWRW